MKNLILYLSNRTRAVLSLSKYYGFAIILLSILIISCNSDDDNGCTGIDCLPPITQTGAGTFGCLVNGEPFVDNSGSFNCFYQLVDGEYFFNISPTFDDPNILELDLGSNNVDFLQTQSFEVSEYVNGKGAAVFFLNDGNRNIETNAIYNGICVITNFDLQQNIMSGTFEFEIFDEQTQTLYLITNGRFDAIFTQ